MAYGVTVNGFVKKNFSVIVDEKELQAIALFGPDVDLTDVSPLYKFIQATSLEEANLWDMAESMYYSAFVGAATGASLDKVVRLLGVYRNAANKATGQVTFSGTNGTIVPQGYIVETTDGVQFTTLAAGTVAGGVIIINVEAVLAGISGNVSSATIVVLTTSLPGITSVTNASAMSGGTNIETDVALRIRALGALEATGNATLEAITQDVLAVAGVTDVLVIENTATHTINVVVKGITFPDATVLAAIDASRAAGIAATWQNPTGIDCYSTVTIDVDQDSYPADAATQIENAMIAYINTTLGIGDDVIYAKLYDIIYNVGAWVIDVRLLKLDIVTPPVLTANIVITTLQEAQTDAAKITPTINPIAPP